MAVALLKRSTTVVLISENVTDGSSRRTSPVTMMLPATTVSVMCSAVMLGWLKLTTSAALAAACAASSKSASVPLSVTFQIMTRS